jgi:hypothetical protein
MVSMADPQSGSESCRIVMGTPFFNAQAANPPAGGEHRNAVFLKRS